jgi:hypothetical protein
MTILFTPEFPIQGATMVRLQRFSTDAAYATVISAGFLDSTLLSGYDVTNYDFLMVSFAEGKGIFSASTNQNGIVTLSPVMLSNSVPQTLSASVNSAAPGTVRGLVGSMTNTATSMTSGNLVGVRGQVSIVGSATAAFVYGTQGKVTATGTLASGQFQAGVFGQADFSAATINAAQFAPIWGDYGTSVGTLTDQTGLYGLAMTNTTAAVLAGQVYLYGGAQNLFLLETNVGLSGVTYFKNSGTSTGSWGNATPPTPSKVLKISVDGTAYYLPLVAQNT